MASNTVNLDALIPRDDLKSDEGRSGGTPRTTVALSDLDQNGFFQTSLRKPDFQRETTHWSPSAVVDLVRAFLDGDLIPAVILWERGDDVFVIDGAHRLSALIAWVRDDYGDGDTSNSGFGSGLSDEQRRVAQATRKLIRDEIGSYAEFKGLVGQVGLDAKRAQRRAAIGKNAISIQWVTATTSEAAETSFFKINQAAVAIDPVERILLQTRVSPNAIASRCIARGGRGHKYWGAFPQIKQQEIEELGACIYEWLYKPPHRNPITTTDVPIAGSGYNALAFVYFLVSVANGLRIPATLTGKSKKLDPALPADEDGAETIAFLRNVKHRLQEITTNHPGSFGFHPLIYYYANSGEFMPVAFLASLAFARKLIGSRRERDFTRIRSRFERYIGENKIFVSLTVHKLGSGARSLERLVDLYFEIFEAFHVGKDENQILHELTKSPNFVHLRQAELPPPSAGDAPSKKGASRKTKSAAFIREALKSPVTCAICGGVIHSNSISFDHLERKSEGGDNRSENINPVHPYCNSGFKG